MSDLRNTQGEFERLLYFLSHDFGAPIRHVAAFNTLIQTELAGHDNPKLLNWLHYMGEGSALLQHYVQEVLSYSRALRAEPLPGTCDLAKLLPKVVEEMASPSEDVRLRSPSADAACVAMATSHAREVLFEILRNAMAFRRPGTTAEILVSFSREASTWKIEVQDAGIGMSKETVAVAFEPFTRSISSPRTSPGLGLAKCQHLVELYGGTISLVSEEGMSTSVFVRLPAAGSFNE